MELMVNRTQFGNLITCSEDYKAWSQILWYLMLRMACTRNKDELWLVVCKRPIRFSLYEYCLITGLDCSDTFPAIQECTDFREKYFAGVSIVLLSDVRTKLEEMADSSSNGVNMDKIKLACLLFVGGLLWPVKEKCDPRIEDKILYLINDIDSFNKYPWGRVAFRGALDSLKKDLAEKEQLLIEAQAKQKCIKNATFSMSGFIQPFQILAYECIPGIREVFATKKEGDNIPLPRMCRWKSNNWTKKKAPSLSEVTDAANKLTSDIIGLLRPTMEEVSAAYVLNGYFSHPSEDVVTEKIVDYMMEGKEVYCLQTPVIEPSTQADVEQPSPRAPEAPTSPSHTHVNLNVASSTSVRSYDNREYLDQRLSQMEANLERKLSKIEVNIDKRLTKIEDTLQILLDCFSEQGNLFARKRKRNGSLSTDTSLQPTSSRYMDKDNVHQSEEIFEHIPYTSTQQIDKDGIHQSEGIFKHKQHTSTQQIDKNDVHQSEGKPCSEPVDQPVLMIPTSPKRVVKKSKFLSTPFTSGPSTTPPIVMKFNPFLSWFDTKAYKKYIKQMELDLNCMEKITIKKGMCGDYNKLWLNKLYTPGSWIDNDHIKECFKGLLVLQKNHPTIIAQDISLMDSYFSQRLINEFNDDKKKNLDTLMKLVTGKDLKWPSIPWQNARCIMFAHNLSNHWILLKVNVKEKEILVFDSDQSCYNRREILSFMRPIGAMIVVLMKKLGIIKNNKKWNVDRPTSFPQQQLCGECGVYAITTAALELSDINMLTLNDDRVADFRKYFTLSIWNNCWTLKRK